MLYIFFVNTGSMISVDMQLALESVAQLKSEIAQRTGIHENKQVLLVSGGQSLNSDERVCSYSAGTDTSPIFLYSKSAIESEEPPAATVDYFSDFDMNEQVERSLNMPATYQTVVSRAQLAQTFYEVSKSLRVSCERLVYDEHLQQQGWAAAVANLEDTASSFGRKAFIIKENFSEYLHTRSRHLELIQSFSSDLGLLAKIPVLPVLLTKQDDEALQNSEITLLNWISSKDKKSTLDEILNRCIAGLNAIDRNILDNMCSEAQKVLETIDNHQMKEIKGLGERLFGLDELISNAKLLEKEQGDLARALLNNQTQAGKCGDAAIYSDLCITHRKQLELLLNNHNHLKDIHKRCSVAKEELCQNLHSRLRWMMFVQNTIVDIENKLMMFYCKLEQLKRYLEFVQKIHVAPKIYLNAVVEVVRRRHFSKNFCQWAGSLAHQSSELHEKEMATRREFNCQIANHFLQPLFPGMADFPPSFAVEPPALFDQDLPNIGIDDIEKLRQRIPELASYLRLPVHDGMPKAITTPTDSALGSEVPSSRVFGTCSIASPTSLDPLCQVLGTHEFATEGFSELDRELFSVASEPSPTSESFVCTDSEGILKQNTKSPVRKKDGDSCKQSHYFDSNQEKEIYSPIEEEHEDSDADEFEQVGEVLKDQSTTELLKVGIHVSEESSMKDRLQKASSEPEDSKLSQSTEVIVLTRTRSDGDIHMQTSDLVTSSTSQEFLTADFFIDESMPSSYTESNGTARGNLLLKSHHMVVAELQRQLEEKSATLIAVQEDLDTSRAQLQKIHCAVGSLQRLAEEVKNQLKYDVVQLKDQVLQDKGMFLQEIANLASHLKTSLENVQRKMEKDKELAVQEAMKQAHEEHKHLVQQYESKFEVQSQNLEDVQRQADLYYDQLRHHCMLLDNEKLDSEAKMETLRRELREEHQEIVQKMMLEHELELENSREEFKKAMDSKEKEFCYVKEAITEKENQIHLLCEDKLSLESVYIDKFQREKAELQRTMEEKYKERERTVVCQALEAQDTAHKRELHRLHMQKENMERELRKEITETMQAEWDGTLQDCRNKLQTYYEELLLEKERQWEAERNRDLCTLREDLERGHKRKIELLHSYFRLSSNECSLLERIQMDCGEEQARQLKEALIQSEKEFDETVSSHKQQHVEMISRKHGLETEKEMSCSDATCSFVRKDHDMDESEKEIGSTSQLMLDSAMQEKIDISEMNQLLLDILQQQKETSEVKQELTELQKKLLETENKLPMHNSVSVVMDTAEKGLSHDSAILELQVKLRDTEVELAAIKQKLIENKSLPCSHGHVHSDKVSVLTCNIGDIVLLCYNDKHENYVVFYLGSALHFLHTDCLEEFGFKNASEENHKTWALAEVLDKEYCLAKKAHNRYKVQVGTRFYRIKAKPWDDQMAARRQHHQKRSSSAGGGTSMSDTSRSTSFPTTEPTSESSTMSASVI